MQSFQTLYVYFAVNFYFIEISTGRILQNIDLDLCESLACMKQFNVTLSYGFNDKLGFVATMNLAALVGTLHFFDSGNIMTQYVDVEDIWASKDHMKKKCAVESAEFDAGYNPLDHGYKFINMSTSSSKVHFQMALQPHQFFDKSRYKQHHSHSLSSSHTKSEEVLQSISDHILMWKVIEWHFQWMLKAKGMGRKLATSSGSETMRCLDIGARSGFYSLLMAQYNCIVDLFESSQSLVDSVKVSVCLNYLHDRIVIHRTAVADGIDGNITNVQSLEIQQLPKADDCIFQENVNKDFALVRIDTDGMEVHVLQGLKSTIDSGLIDAIVLDFCPSCWERIGLSISQGFDELQKLLGDKFSPHIVIGSDMCPHEVFTGSSQHDVLIDEHVNMKGLTWNNVKEILEILKKNHHQCNFLLLQNSHSLSERLETISFPRSY
jgi:FkbM family methyltransferase